MDILFPAHFPCSLYLCTDLLSLSDTSRRRGYWRHVLGHAAAKMSGSPFNTTFHAFGQRPEVPMSDAARAKASTAPSLVRSAESISSYLLCVDAELRVALPPGKCSPYAVSSQWLASGHELPAPYQILGCPPSPKSRVRTSGSKVQRTFQTDLMPESFTTPIVSSLNINGLSDLFCHRQWWKGLKQSFGARMEKVLFLHRTGAALSYACLLA